MMLQSIIHFYAPIKKNVRAKFTVLGTVTVDHASVPDVSDDCKYCPAAGAAAGSV